MLDFLTKKKPVVEAPAMQTPMPEGAAHAQLDKPDLMSVADAAKEPLRDFLVKHSSPRERAFFLQTAQKNLPAERAAQLTDKDFPQIYPLDDGGVFAGVTLALVHRLADVGTVVQHPMEVFLVDPVAARRADVVVHECFCHDRPRCSMSVRRL